MSFVSLEEEEEKAKKLRFNHSIIFLYFVSVCARVIFCVLFVSRL